MFDEYLDFWPTNPSDSREIVLHQQVVRLVVEAPLADDKIRTRVLDHADHVCKLLALVFAQALVLLYGCDLELVLRLRPRGLERACQDGEPSIFDRVRHLRVREVLVDEYTPDERRVRERAADLAVNLNEVERHVTSLHVRDCKHGVDSDLCELLVLF